MLSAHRVYCEIFEHDNSFRLFCSIAAAGESQGGWENGRIAALMPPSQAELAPKVARHGADEDKHGRIFTALLRKRGLQPVPVPPETNYTKLLEETGLGLAHSRLNRGEPLSERDIVTYLAHSRVTEQRAAEQMASLLRNCADYPDIHRAVTMISRDEDNHLAYCHEELLLLGNVGHDRFIRSALRECALAEIRIHRDVSLAVITRISRILGWPRWKTAVLCAGIQVTYGYERLYGWRRMVSIRMPERRNALGGPVHACL